VMASLSMGHEFANGKQHNSGCDAERDDGADTEVTVCPMRFVKERNNPFYTEPTPKKQLPRKNNMQNEQGLGQLTNSPNIVRPARALPPSITLAPHIIRARRSWAHPP